MELEIQAYSAKSSLVTECEGEELGEGTEWMLELVLEGVKLDRDWAMDWGEGE